MSKEGFSERCVGGGRQRQRDRERMLKFADKLFEEPVEVADVACYTLLP